MSDARNQFAIPCRTWRHSFSLLGRLLVLLLPTITFADGKVVSQIAVALPATIPDQRALIYWTNGVERLVIETRFTGEGTNFAWVVPLPAKPVIEEAPIGLFPTVEYLFRGQIVHKVARWHLGVLALLGLIYILCAIKPGEPLSGKVILAWAVVCASALAISPPLGLIIGMMLLGGMVLVRLRQDSVYVILALTLLGGLLGSMLLPALGRGKAAVAGKSEQVEVLERVRVGIFETTTIAANDPLALGGWLRDNGYALSSNAAPVIASYVKEGWVFVAAKVRRDRADMLTSTPHPLSFTFPAQHPIYPMRLTGIDNGPLTLELYVFGPERASAPHCKTDRCTRPAVPPPRVSWTHIKPAGIEINYSPLREWVGGAAVATKLSAKLDGPQMADDLRLRWASFRESGDRVFSYQGAAHFAANWAILAFVVVVTVVYVVEFSWRKRRQKVAGGRWWAAGLALVIGTAVFAGLPKTQVILERGRLGRSHTDLRMLATGFHLMTRGANLVQVREEFAYWMTNVYEGVRWGNTFLGGRIHEEDSPGNYVLRESPNGIEFIGYDATASPHVLEILPANKPPL